MNIQQLSFTSNGCARGFTLEAVYIVTIDGIAHYVRLRRSRHDPNGNQTGNFSDQTSASFIDLDKSSNTDLDEDAKLIIGKLLEKEDGVKRNKIIYDHAKEKVISVE